MDWMPSSKKPSTVKRKHFFVLILLPLFTLYVLNVIIVVWMMSFHFEVLQELQHQRQQHHQQQVVSPYRPAVSASSPGAVDFNHQSPRKSSLLDDHQALANTIVADTPVRVVSHVLQRSLPNASTATSLNARILERLASPDDAARFKALQLKSMPESTCQHRHKGDTSTSSVEYLACCGLGHRLARMTGAALFARTMQVPLHSYWGCCDELDLFSELFGPEPFILYNETATAANTEAAAMEEKPFHIQIKNEAPGIVPRASLTSQDRCSSATQSKLESDYVFYSTLIMRYKHSRFINSFKTKYFKHHTVVGMHIRAGNGEGGDFAKKGRSIQDHDQFVKDMVGNITHLTKNVIDPPLLFIATDTSSYVDSFREALRGKMDVLDVPQLRAKEGEGVLFGEAKAWNNHAKETCLEGWDSAVNDMMLLSQVDLLLVGTPSSFIHAMPKSILLGRPHQKVKTPFCEIKPKLGLTCYKDGQDWSCNGAVGATRTGEVDPSWRHLLAS